jgi:hypothetical protein
MYDKLIRWLENDTNAWIVTISAIILMVYIAFIA